MVSPCLATQKARSLSRPLRRPRLWVLWASTRFHNILVPRSEIVAEGSSPGRAIPLDPYFPFGFAGMLENVDVAARYDLTKNS